MTTTPRHRGASLDELPAWVTAFLEAVEHHSVTHAPMFARYFPNYELQPAATCGCEGLGLVPSGIREERWAASGNVFNGYVGEHRAEVAA